MKFSCIFVITFWCSLFIYEKSTAMRDENFVIQTDNEGFNDSIEKNTETGTLDMERNAINPISGDESLIIKPSDEALNVNSEKNAEMVSSDMQRKGKKSKSIRNCLDLKKQGKGSGTYLIKPCDNTNKIVKVYCDMDTDRGGWTVIQRRDNFRQQQEFNNTWYEYSIGFGDIAKDFWLGNDNIHCLTKQSQNEIRFDLQHRNGTKYFANYGFFYVDDQTNKYKMEVQNFTGNTIYDGFAYHSNRSFTTFDNDNDQNSGNCASYYYNGGWWFGSCYYSFLNGAYNTSRISWYGVGYLKMSEMKIRPRY